MRVDWAVWRPVAYSGLTPRTSNKAAVLHTNGGVSPGGSLFDWFSSLARGDHGADRMREGSHFQVAFDGTVEQYADTDWKLGHAWDANAFAVGIETEDGGDPGKPWTDAQLDSIVRLLKSLGVPAKDLPVGGGDGLGWHEEHDAWNQSGHICPGAAREAQIKSAVMPRLKEGDDHMTDKEISEALERITGIGVNRQKDLEFAIGVQRRVMEPDKPKPTEDRQAKGWQFADDALKAKPPAGGTPAHEHSGGTSGPVAS